MWTADWRHWHLIQWKKLSAGQHSSLWHDHDLVGHAILLPRSTSLCDEPNFQQQDEHRLEVVQFTLEKCLIFKLTNFIRTKSLSKTASYVWINFYLFYIVMKFGGYHVLPSHCEPTQNAHIFEKAMSLLPCFQILALELNSICK